MLWQSSPIQFDNGVRGEVSVTDDKHVVFSAHKDETLLVEVRGSFDQFGALGNAITAAQDKCGGGAA